MNRQTSYTNRLTVPAFPPGLGGGYGGLLIAD
jgi:hypothetical protein